MAPIRGWSPRGQRLQAQVPHGHWKTLTLIAEVTVVSYIDGCFIDFEGEGAQFSYVYTLSL